MIGIGITTFNRPDYFSQCLEHVLKNTPKDTKIFVYNDASTVEYPEQVKGITYIVGTKNKGVAHAKNTLLTEMLNAKCDYIFLIEDDILITDETTLSQYIRVSKETGWEHFSFYNHGPANKSGAVYRDELVCYFPHAVGAFCFYTRHALETLKYTEAKTQPYPGLFDENFKNAFEHVDHTKRLGDNALTSPFGLFADITGSEKLLEEIPGSIKESSIRPNKNWRKNMEDALKYWETRDGEKPPITI